MNSALDYFPGGIPSGDLFKMSLDELHALVEMWSPPKPSMSNVAIELAFIGLVSYCEAFFKNQYAAVINLYPELLRDLKSRNIDIRVDAIDLLAQEEPNINQIGFLVSEPLDFGTPQKINSLYTTLLNITPFLNDEKKDYETIIKERNLIVHHGGIYTSKYFEQKAFHANKRTRPHYDSLVITKNRFYSASQLLGGVARKTTAAIGKALRERIHRDAYKLSRQEETAITFLSEFD